MNQLTCVLAVLGALLVLRVCWELVISPMILAIKYTNATMKMLKDKGFSFFKRTKVIPSVFFSQWWYLSHGIGTFITGGQVGCHHWGSEAGDKP